MSSPPALSASPTNLWFPGQQKPQGLPRINWNHSLAAGLIFYGFDGGSELYDLTIGRPSASGLYTQGLLKGAPWGEGKFYNGGYSGNWKADAAIQNTSAAGFYTFACGYVKTSTVGASGRPFGRTANNNASPFLNWVFQLGSSQTQMQCFMYGNSTFNSIGTWSGSVDNTYQTLMGVANDTTHATFYANGAQVSTFTLGAGTWGSFNTNDSIIFGGGSDVFNTSASPWTGLVYWGAFWSRPLSASEAMLLHLDPYCFLSSQDGAFSLLQGSSPPPPVFSGNMLLVF